ATHGADIADAAQAAFGRTVEAAHDQALYPGVFSYGEGIGVLNGATRLYTDPMAMSASVESTTTRIIGEAFGVPDALIDDTISRSPSIAEARRPDELRLALVDYALSMGDAEMARAARNGAVVGE